MVIDLYARRVVGWAMQSRMHIDLVLSALPSAVWRHKQTSQMIVHSDQGSLFISYERRSFLGMLSPIDFEKQQYWKVQGITEIRRDPDHGR